MIAFSLLPFDFLLLSCRRGRLSRSFSVPQPQTEKTATHSWASIMICSCDERKWTFPFMRDLNKSKKMSVSNGPGQSAKNLFCKPVCFVWRFCGPTEQDESKKIATRFVPAPSAFCELFFFWSHSTIKRACFEVQSIIQFLFVHLSTSN